MNTERLAERIKAHEGLRLKPYTDSLGRITIGYGRCLDTRGISRDEADTMFNRDMVEAASNANLIVGAKTWRGIGETRQEILTEMVYQLGAGGVDGFRNMIAALRDRNYERAADEMLDSRWHDQTPARAEELAALMREGGT